MCQGGSSSERPLTSAEVLDSFLEHKSLTVRFLGHFPLGAVCPTPPGAQRLGARWGRPPAWVVAGLQALFPPGLVSPVCASTGSRSSPSVQRYPAPCSCGQSQASPPPSGHLQPRVLCLQLLFYFYVGDVGRPWPSPCSCRCLLLL